MRGCIVPAGWTGFDCSIHDWPCGSVPICFRNSYVPGTYRFVVKSCDGKLIAHSEPFVVPVPDWMWKGRQRACERALSRLPPDTNASVRRAYEECARSRHRLSLSECQRHLAHNAAQDIDTLAMAISGIAPRSNVSDRRARA